MRRERTYEHVAEQASEASGEFERSQARDRRVRDDFISLIAHELKSSLTSIAGYTQLVLRQPNMPAEKRGEHLEVILSEARRLTRLINDLRESSRWDSGELQPRRAPADLDEVIRHVAARVAPPAHRLLLDLPERPILGELDADRIGQVLTNLLTNAVKYSPEGSEIRVTVRRGTDWVEVSVGDQGIGIAEEDMAKLFQPFYRGRQTTEVYGSGLGLHLARQIVEAHGGQIWVQSRPGEGSTFTFRLPLT